ncbi:MAG: hypothetical protein FI718_08200 [SAR202 cluster bacterium]|nr:hypothetical protein [SAR202 cluster bacterium]|tara:strand:- start:335 stop:619 length:285 start_codon:yes stop_codon:yes gene_type:complete
MYGTIFNLKVKSGHESSLIDLFKKYEKPEGGVAWYVMKPDNQQDWIGVAVFSDKESYKANAENPEQHQRFLEMMEHLEAEPTWTDGNYVVSQLN